MASMAPEWNRTCRVCLQEGEILSLYALCPESNLSYGAKVMQCSSIRIQRDDNMPEQICVSCILDLNVAYRFRVNCESSDAILQSLREPSSMVEESIGIDEDDVGGHSKDQPRLEEVDDDDSRLSVTSEIQIPIGSDVVYSYKPPIGLNVKLVSREQKILNEAHGEIVVCGLEHPLSKVLPESSDPRKSRVCPEPVVQDDDDNDSLITYDDALPPPSSQAEEDVEEPDDESEVEEEQPKMVNPDSDQVCGMMATMEDQQRSEMNETLVEDGDDSRTVDKAGKKLPRPDDSSTDIFFNAQLVYVDKEDDILNQLAEIKREDEVDEDWEIIYDDDENGDTYFQKLPQTKATTNPVVPKVLHKVQFPEPSRESAVAHKPTNSNSNASLVKTIQTIRKTNIPNEQKPTIENIITKPGPDGSFETVIRVKRNLKPAKQQHVCKICNSSYKYKHALETHMRRHRGDKPYKCSECEKAFVVPFELRRHMRTHTGAKPYKCKYCERKFSDFGSKIKHERTHTGERPYVCDVCEKSFTYSHVLNSHMLIHTGVKKYSCSDCGKRFAKSHHLKAHLNTHVRVSSSSTNNNNSTIKSMLQQPSKPSTIHHPTTLHMTSHNNSVSGADPTLGLGPTVPIAVEDGLVLDPGPPGSSVDQLMVDGIDDRSSDFHLDGDDPGAAFGQLVNIGDYMISSKADDPRGFGAIMDDDDDDDDGRGNVVGVEEDSLLNVVTVLAANQVAGLVEGDYSNIRVING
ncbi:zinc finger protein 629-like [Uranotaenia lowii]|uniref:zinc finger protein 629-like n=1 Tax=Uranotaenia lowii TaxID=190385 RepID=UPI002478B616|nr:zinc finger protein 629-like [Uranotaenia lowii]